MPIGLVFWFLMLLWIISWFFYYRFAWSTPAGDSYGRYNLVGSDVMILVLFFLLGWHDFGFIVRYS